MPSSVVPPHLVNDDLWHVKVPIWQADRNIMRMETDELFIGLWYRKDSFTLIALAPRLM